MKPYDSFYNHLYTVCPTCKINCFHVCPYCMESSTSSWHNSKDAKEWGKEVTEEKRDFYNTNYKNIRKLKDLNQLNKKFKYLPFKKFFLKKKMFEINERWK